MIAAMHKFAAFLENFLVEQLFGPGDQFKLLLLLEQEPLPTRYLWTQSKLINLMNFYNQAENPVQFLHNSNRQPMVFLVAIG